MSFRRRYADSLLSAESRPAPDLAPRRAPGVGWWRRYLASLFDMPAVRAPARAGALRSALENGVEGGLEGGVDVGLQRPSRGAEFRAGTESNRRAVPPTPADGRRAGTRRTSFGAGKVVVSPQGPGPWRWAVAAAMVCVLAGVLTVTLRHPGPDLSQPAPTVTVGASPSEGSTADASTPPATEEPTPSASTGAPGGRVVWRGSLTFVAQPGMSDLSVVATPATPSLADGTALSLCASSCQPPVIDGELVAHWAGAKPPTYSQCVTALAGRSVSTSVPVRVGQTACFATEADTIGFFTVTATSPGVSAAGVIWSL
ncbi:hypothetical protein [Streptacidiphilus melanogenes]|uniref:hypothetical protein n=1 Tax=Streptacidiphilus melanogenes TaxID=411235 RepID=UPI0005A9F4CD|nr:hypothetical protein [Streptacidiphilus melanogenes]